MEDWPFQQLVIHSPLMDYFRPFLFGRQVFKLFLKTNTLGAMASGTP